MSINKKMSINKDNLYYNALFLFSVASTVFLDSTLNGFIGLSNSGAYYLFYYFSIIMLLYRTVAYGKIRKKELLIAVFGAILIWITYRNAGSDFFVPAFLFIVCGKKVDYNKVVRTILYAQIFSVLLIVLMAIFGIIDNMSTVYSYSYLSTTVVKTSLGFKHPNIFGARLLQIGLCFLYLVYDRWKTGYYVILGVIATIVYNTSYSRTAVLLLLLAVLLVFLVKRMQNQKVTRRLLTVMEYMPIIVCSFSIILALFFTTSELFAFMDKYFTARFTAITQFFSQYGFSILGQEIELSRQSNGLFFTILDNSYAHIGIRFGLIMLVVFIFALQKTAQKARKSDNYALLILVTIISLLGMSETTMFRVSYNFVILFISALIFPENSLAQKSGSTTRY